ncbi:MAG: hypothetical protein KGS45_05565 [Planctomycetes bacterium]|nr:hypothetical protein [Planctomycetota bacterium]
MSNPEQIRNWQNALEGAIEYAGSGGKRYLNRAVVVAEALSTQDLARAHGEQAAGVVVAALRQTGGRGRLGRSWADTAALGVAVSMAIDVRGVEVLARPGVLALVAGLAALRAVRSQHCTPESLGMKWPNDVVERASGRKLAGVLIEQFGTLAVIGVGVNVLQRAEDFPPELGDSAISILESDVAGALHTERVLKREDVAAAVVREVSHGLAMVDQIGLVENLEREFAAADVLRGSTQTLICDGVSYRGRILSVEPLQQITIATSQGTRVLDAAKTQMERFQKPSRRERTR